MHPLTIRHAVRPVRRSLATGHVADLFGLAHDPPPHTVADGVRLDVRPGDLVLFTGPSGSGKSSLLRAVGSQLGAVDAMGLELPDVPLVDALGGPVEGRLKLLAACGLSEARLLLRTPGELSDGQRYRFRLAYALGAVGTPASRGSLRSPPLDRGFIESRPPGSDAGASGCRSEPASGDSQVKPRSSGGERSEPREAGVGSDPPSPSLRASGSASPDPRDGGRFLLADEFAANLDRTLARVLAFNLRKLVTRTGVGALLATTHEDVIADLRPDLHVRCLGDGDVRPVRDDHARQPWPVSFAAELTVEEGSRRDWPSFARWHYRSHHLGFVKRVVLLKHGGEPVGICVFASPAAALAARSRYFGLRGPRSRLGLDALNAQLWVLSRVVLHPTYRGAGIAADFIRRACRTCPVPWVETLSAMGHANPVFERAGFVRAGVVRKAGNPRRYGGQFGRRGALTRETVEKTRYSEPVYYVFDNRGGS